MIEAFSEYIKDSLERLGISNKQLAKELHVSVKTLSEWRTGKSSPHILTQVGARAVIDGMVFEHEYEKALAEGGCL